MLVAVLAVMELQLDRIGLMEVPQLHDVAGSCRESCTDSPVSASSATKIRFVRDDVSSVSFP